MSDILITGANGQLGTELRHLLDSQGVAYDAFDAQQMDITDAAAVNKRFAAVNPRIVFHCAAFTAVDPAEDEKKDLNWRVNEDGTRNVAEAAQKAGATLFYISTDYVFDGTNAGEYEVDAPTNPKNEYGKAKLAGEQIVASVMDKYYIIRTSWVFGEYGKNFVYTMRRLAKDHDKLTVVDDQVGRPTWTRTLAEFMLYAVQHQIPYGYYQLSNDGCPGNLKRPSSRCAAGHVGGIPAKGLPSPAFDYESSQGKGHRFYPAFLAGSTRRFH